MRGVSDEGGEERTLVAAVNDCLNECASLLLSTSKGTMVVGVKDDILGDTMIAAARTLHSALDDNPPLMNYVSSFGTVWLALMMNETSPIEYRMHVVVEW